MDLSVKLQAFEGPMDLLLHLIDKNKVSIYDIPIAAITDQYFEYIDQMRREDMEIMSEFLVMAATLLDIKARMLLPPEKDEEGEEIDPRSELVEKLLEYKMYKYMSYELREREGEAMLSLYREECLPKEVALYKEPVDPHKLLGDLTLERMKEIFQEVMKRQEERVDPIRSQFGKIEKETVDAGEVMRSVRRNILKKKNCTFRSLLTAGRGKMYTVVTFLTILELMKIGRVEVSQDDTFGEISITVKDAGDWGADEQELKLEYE
ncbi:MAG: segregation/condensation protein A [Lachnospiraceae bacterium]|nr:segregation/condensation protein A [Lachnospiraceae bacterium]